MDYNVRIKKLDITNYKAYNPTNDKNDYTGHVNVKGKAGINEESRSIIIHIDIEMLLNIKENDELGIVGTLETINVYTISEDDWNQNVRQEGEKLIIDEKLDNFLINISYNNARGLLRERGKDDLFGKIVLPLVDPKDITRKET